MAPTGRASSPISAAARGPGFFLLKGHGIDPDLQAEVFAQADRFFALPDGDQAGGLDPEDPALPGLGA
jgi:isopenicillin N synthase-like dioxygenase